MHPTVDEQLNGAQRLIDVAQAAGSLSPASTEALTNARRLLKAYENALNDARLTEHELIDPDMPDTGQATEQHVAQRSPIHLLAQDLRGYKHQLHDG